jgi:hypothetical protein
VTYVYYTSCICRDNACNGAVLADLGAEHTPMSLSLSPCTMQACAFGAIPVLATFDGDVLHVETLKLRGDDSQHARLKSAVAYVLATLHHVQCLRLLVLPGIDIINSRTPTVPTLHMCVCLQLPCTWCWLT